MEIRVVEIEQIEENKFAVVTIQGALKRTDILQRDEYPIASTNESAYFYTAEKPDFGEIWGSSFELRREVSEKIKELVEKQSLQFAQFD